MNPPAMPVNGGKVRGGGAVEAGMPIEIERGETDAKHPYLCLKGDSYRCYANAVRAVSITAAEDALNEKMREMEVAAKAHREATKVPMLDDYPTDVEKMWKLVLRMREIRGVDPPVLTSADLRGAVVDLLRMEVHAFDVALEQAREDGASS